MSSKKVFSLIPKPVRKFIIRSTRQGRVDDIKKMNSNLQENSDLVAKQYGGLNKVEKEIGDVLYALKNETFEAEMKEIDTLTDLPKKERESLKNSLELIKEKGIADLTPISATSQKIKGHMLVTLNKAQVQRTILSAKMDLAENAHIQVETLQIIGEETKNINEDLENLIDDLDRLNASAINEYSTFKKSTKDIIESSHSNEITEKDTEINGTNIIDVIVNKSKKYNEIQKTRNSI